MNGLPGDPSARQKHLPKTKTFTKKPCAPSLLDRPDQVPPDSTNLVISKPQGPFWETVVDNVNAGRDQGPEI
jgi:hypothetical protein